jgi:hypothetical protein
VRYTLGVSVSGKRRASGATIGTVLLLTVVVVTLALALTGSSVTHLQLSQRTGNATIAQGMAESVIAAGLEKILDNDEFGVIRSESDVLELPGSGSATFGRLTFNESIAGEWSVPYSTNNLQFEGAKSGAAGRVVPGSSIHLVGQGECNGVRRTVEAIFYVPKFPYVVATSGKFETQGQTLIASVDRADALKNFDFDNLEDLQPGDVLANSRDKSALILSKDTFITGDAKSAGGVSLEPGAEILGQILDYSSPESIPEYSVAEFDPNVTGKLGVSHLRSGTVNNANYEGWVRREGDLFVGQGLNLDNGVLYVNGNLTVTGGVTGVGAILVTGDTIIRGRSSLSTDNLAAIVSEGPVTLQGTQQQSSVFRGLVYSNQGLTAENMTLVGTLLIGGEDHDLTLKDTRIVYSPDSVRVDLQHSARTALHFVSPKGSNPGAFIGTKGSDRTVDNKTRIFVSNETDGTFVIYLDGTDEADGSRADTVEEAIAVIRSYLAIDTNGTDLQAFESSAVGKLTPILTDLQNGSLVHQEEAVDLLTFDPTSFLSLADKIRLLLIRNV